MRVTPAGTAVRASGDRWGRECGADGFHGVLDALVGDAEMGDGADPGTWITHDEHTSEVQLGDQGITAGQCVGAITGQGGR